MKDLADFLLARIAEDHEVARKGTPGPWTWSGEELLSTARYSAVRNRLVLGAVEPGPWDEQVSEWNREHIARWHTSQVLAECAAKRALVQQAMGWLGDGKAWGQDVTILADQMLRTLAWPYNEHPEYREEWRS